MNWQEVKGILRSGDTKDITLGKEPGTYFKVKKRKRK